MTIVICWQFIIEKSLELWQYLQANFPIYMEMVSKSFADAIQFTANTWQKITEVNSHRILTLVDLMQYIDILGIKIQWAKYFERRYNGGKYDRRREHVE